MRAVEAYLQARDGVGLFVRRFEPRSRDADRWLFLVHGMAEHGECYEHVARSAVARGWNVVVPDLRGHGRSGGEHIHVSSFSEYVADLRQIFDWGGLSAHNTVMVGHSMGGLISAHFVRQNPECVSALAMLSPLLGVNIRVSPFMVGLGKFLSYVRPKSRFHKRTNPAYSSRDPEAVMRRSVDPLIRHSLTAAWFFAMRAAMRSVWDLAEQIACPLLVMQAGSDRVVDPQAPHRWIERVGSADKTLRIFPDHYHELLNEIDWPNTVADLLDWLETRVLERSGIASNMLYPLRETA
jgi:lysophospholipase